MADTTAFRSFTGCPTEGAATPDRAWWLLAQVKENMTITKPTLVATDRTGEDFALTFEDRSVSLKSFRKGHTVVVPRAWRTVAEEGKKGYVLVAEGDGGVKGIPAGLERVLELGKTGGGEKCATCGKAKELMKCTGCASVRYCGKVSAPFILRVGRVEVLGKFALMR